MSLSSLFPPIEPYHSEYLTVSDGHSLYVELCGNPEGSPAVVLHGGPGSGCLREYRRFFDPSHYRIILFDQRGAGRSSPLGSVYANTTDKLVDDLEAIRRHLGIEQWLILGGSWGSTLALVYATTYPEHCLALVLRGLWLARPQDLHWKWTSAQMVHPELWRDFVNHLPIDEREDLIGAYHRRLFDPDPTVHIPAALAWHRFEMHRTALIPKVEPDNGVEACSPQMLALCRIETHYFLNRAFLGKRPLINRAASLSAVPGAIIHGRYDMLCPVEGAAALSSVWPRARLTIVQDAGHSTFEPGIQAELVAAIDRTRDHGIWH
jgi:proline iminopeptidase